MTRVSVSLVVFEAEPWVDVLIKNLWRFVERATGVMMHLNSLSYYSPTALRRWNDTRNDTRNTGVAGDRVPVRWGT